MLRVRSLLQRGVAAAAAPSRSALTYAVAAPAFSFSTEAAADSASAAADAAAPVAGAAAEYTMPASLHDRHRNKKAFMPSSRGAAWGQSLTSNSELSLSGNAWTPKSRRSGALGRKLGMMSVWSAHGETLPVTLIQIEHCQVLTVNPDVNSSRGTISMELGAVNRKEKNVTKPMLGHFHRARVPPKQFVRSTEITADAALPVGWEIDARHFVPGQFVDVTGTTVGKGFQGVMKRWGFAGQPASHGVSVTHRSLGSTGMRQDPGHVFKNKKMPGHMGAAQRTQQNLRLYKIDPALNVLYVIGQVPGHAENIVYVRDAVKRAFNPASPPPFPTFVPPAQDDKTEMIMPDALLGPDPFAGGAV